MIGATAACGGGAGRVEPVSTTAPDSAIASFLAAAKDGSLERMASLWGDERGPSDATNTIAPDERQRRLAIMQRLLIADEHQVLSWAPSPRHRSRRVYQVELTREGRRATVPFTMARSRGGEWLVAEIGLEAAIPLARPPQS